MTASLREWHAIWLIKKYVDPVRTLLSRQAAGLAARSLLSQDRAIEDRCDVVISSVVGGLPDMENMYIHYAESCAIAWLQAQMVGGDDPFSDLFVSYNDSIVQ